MARRFVWSEDTEDSNTASWLAWAVIFSLLLHWSLSKSSWLQQLLANMVVGDRSDTANEERFVEVTGPLVQTERAKNKSKDDSKRAEFAGEFRNRVDRQTKANRSGRFRPEIERKQSGKAGQGAPAEGTDPTETVAPGGGTLSMQDLMPQQAAGMYRLPSDIEEGSATFLNTDPVRYASYLNRIADAVYDPWVANARAAAEMLMLRGKALEGMQFVTKLAVVLGEDGAVRSVTILESSGIPALDDAPKRAFLEAEKFTNPPKSLLQGRKEAKLMYQFHFEWRSGGLSIAPFRL